MTLADMIQECIYAKARIESKTSNNDFALFWVNGHWSAEIGNPCQAVMLGEAAGEFSAGGSAPEEAVSNLLTELTAY